MNFEKLTEDILKNIGGESNINSLTHCATRLRFNLKDFTKANEEKLKKVTGVIGVVNKGGQLQIIIGNEVSNAYKSIMSKINIKDVKKDNENGEKKGIINNILDTIAGVFSPILPAIVGAGLLKAFLSILVLFGINQEGHTYYFLNFISDSALYFLPIMLAYTSAVKFKCNQFISMAIAGAMIHPNYIALITDPYNLNFTSFLGLPVTLATYSSSVIPVLLTTYLLSNVESLLEKFIPKMLKFFLKPLLCLLIVTPIAFIFLGPIGFIVGTGICTVLNTINTYVGWLVPTIMGIFAPLLVMTGMHYALVPFMMQSLSTFGYETIAAPGQLGSNVGQGAAALCVALKTKNKELKQLAFSSGITAVLGVTEPAMYGVNLKLKKPLYAVMIGGGVSGLYAGITGVKCFSFCSAGLLALPVFIGNGGISNVINAFISMLIGFAVTFIIVWFWGFEDVSEENDNVKENIEVKDNTEIIELNNIKNEKIQSPIEGNLISLNEVNDPTFAEEIMGKGIAIEPAIGRVLSLVNGVVSALFPTKHAIGIVSDNGAEMLIHIGIDTVNLQGKYFKAHVKAGDRLIVGQLMIEFEIDKIKESGYEVTTPVLITNTDSYKDIKNIANGFVNEKKDIMITIAK